MFLIGCFKEEQKATDDIISAYEEQGKQASNACLLGG